MVSLPYNTMSSIVPKSFASSKSLELLDLSNNEFSGTLESFKDTEHDSKFKLSLSVNYFSGKFVVMPVIVIVIVIHIVIVICSSSDSSFPV